MRFRATVDRNLNCIGKDGILYNYYAGDQSVSSLRKACDEIAQLIEELRGKKKKVLVLTNITKLGSINLKARIFAVEFVRNMDFDKVAIFGNNILAEQIVSVIINASGKSFNMKYFVNEQEAKDWLLL